MTNANRIGPLFTDLYELTMAASYWDHRIFGKATFSLFIRPSGKRGYFIAAGLEDALRELAQFHFTAEEIEYLRSKALFSADFLSYLKSLRFTGQVYAQPEGSIFFADEPILEVTAPVIEAQILETFLINTIGFQTLIASKAARCVHAARGRPLIDFSLRRTQGQDAGLKVARNTYLAGFTATSNVLAGKLYGIPISGTMAHSFITAFDNEAEAFAAYAETFPLGSIFLIDTYDTLAGARNAAKVANNMKQNGRHLIGVRLDSGDMADLSIKVRRILDGAGLSDVRIFASSGLDEYEIADLLARKAEIDAFGVGTKIGVSADMPYLDIVYKMVRYDHRDVKKLSPGKRTLAGKKQVFRKRNQAGMYQEDIIGVRNERMQDTETLLVKVMEDGQSLVDLPALPALQARFKANFEALDERYKALQNPLRYPVKLSQRLEKLQAEI